MVQLRIRLSRGSGAPRGHKKHVKAELSAFVVPAESSPGILCAAPNHGDRDMLLGAPSLPRGKRRCMELS